MNGVYDQFTRWMEVNYPGTELTQYQRMLVYNIFSEMVDVGVGKSFIIKLMFEFDQHKSQQEAKHAKGNRVT